MDSQSQAYLNSLNSVAIIGASGGVGSAILDQCLTSQSITSIHCFSRQCVSSADSRVHYHHIDYSDERTIQNALENLPPELTFDLIFIATGALHDNNMMPEKSISQYSAEKAQHFYLINTIGPSLIMKHFGSRLTPQRVCIFAALSARIGSIGDNRLGGWYSYRASKAALCMMMKSFSIEISRRHKQAICVTLHPGTVDSELSKPFQKNINPSTLMTPKQSALQLISTLSQLNVEQSGSQFAYDGQLIPC